MLCYPYITNFNFMTLFCCFAISRSTTVYYDSDLENNTHGDDNSNLEHSPMNMVQLMNEGVDKLRYRYKYCSILN